MRPSRPRARRGFTLVELIVAGVLTAMIVGTLSATLGQLSRAKGSCKERLDAHLRADTALNNIRRDFAAIIRADDLFYTRFLLLDDDVNSTLGVLPRDEAVVFCTQIRPIRSLDFNGEGSEYETQYRVDEETGVPVLWQRRDAFPDDYPLAGGQAEPLVEHILSLEIEAYDGEQWYVEWDSDEDGLPLAVRVTVMASGARSGQDSYDAVIATMRTVIPMDRTPPPVDQLALTEEELEELDARVLIDPESAATGENDREDDEDEGQNGESGGTGGSGGTSGRGNRGGSGGGSDGGSGDSGQGRGGGSGPDRQDFDDNLPPT